MNPDASPPYEFLEHTADIRLRAHGCSLEELFINSAQGMMEYIFGTEARCLDTDSEECISLSAAEPDVLLVDWLSAVLLKISLEKRIFPRIVFDEFSKQHLRARLYGAAAIAREEIKAVTYYDLSIKQTAKRWETVITFDI